MNRIIVVCAIILFAACAKDQDRVLSLPGYPDFSTKFSMYSGLIPLNADPLVNMHYIFVTSQSGTPLKDPVVLWLNGGPGCSSLLGFAQEIGPVLMLPGAKAFSGRFNPYSWNLKANVLFLENPPGVGFSINNDPNYNHQETVTAQTAYQALLNWFTSFPEYKANDFWITGQSYCGMYIPYLANQIVVQNTSGQINFKGIMIGNGVMVTDKHWRRQARDTFYSRHQFYGTEINSLLSSCKYDNTDQIRPRCVQGQRLADSAVQTVNPYATIGLCYGVSSQAKVLNLSPRRRYYYTPWFQQNNPLGSDDPPCTDESNLALYLNDIAVKKALNVNINTTWISCNQTIGETYKKSPNSTWIFSKLKMAGVKVMLYSGNTDAVVSHIESERYIMDIGFPKRKGPTVIKNDLDSMIGWRTQYDGLTYYVVNGAGHMVPTDKPGPAYTIFTEFLNS